MTRQPKRHTHHDLFFERATVRKAPHGAGERSYRQELVDRAALLLRLGVTKAAAQSRLRSYVAWDFELRGNTSIAKEVDRIVDGVYRRSGPGPGAPTL